MQKNILFIAVPVVVALGAWAVLSGGTFTLPGADGADEPVAVVNGEEIAQSEVDALRAQVALEQGFDPATLDGDAQVRLREQVIEALISQALLRQAVVQVGITTPEEEIDAQIASIKGQFTDDGIYEEALAAEGLTEETLRERIGTEIAIQSYLEQELSIASISATEAEVAEAYAATESEDTPPLEDVFAQLEELVIQQKRQALITELVAALRADATVELIQ